MQQTHSAMPTLVISIFDKAVAALQILAWPVEGDEEPTVELRWCFPMTRVSAGFEAQLKLPAARELVQRLRRAVDVAAQGGKLRESVFLGENEEISVFVCDGSIELYFGPGPGPDPCFQEFTDFGGGEGRELAQALEEAVAAFDYDEEAACIAADKSSGTEVPEREAECRLTN